MPLSVAWLGPAKYGLFSVYSVLAMYVSLLDLGVTKDLTRLLASEPNPAKKILYLRTALGFYLWVALAILLLLPLAWWLIPRYIFPMPAEFIASLRMIIFLSLFEYFIGIPSALIRSYSIASQQFSQYARFNVVTGVYKYVFQLFAVIVFASPTLAVACIVSRKFIDILTARWLMTPLPKEAWYPSFKGQQLLATIRKSSILSLGQLFQATVLMIGSVLVNRSFGIVSLGLYRAAFDLANRIWFFSNGLGAVLFPKFAKDLTNTERRSKLLMAIPQYLQISWMTYMWLATVGVFIAPVALQVMHLTQPGVVALFMVLLIGLCMNAHSNLSYEFIQAAGNYFQVLAATLIALLAMLISFKFFINSYGLLAIGWAWIISQCLFAIVTDMLTLRYANYIGTGQVKIFSQKLLWLAPALLMLMPIAIAWKILIIVVLSSYQWQSIRKFNWNLT